MMHMYLLDVNSLATIIVNFLWCIDQQSLGYILHYFLMQEGTLCILNL